MILSIDQIKQYQKLLEPILQFEERSGRLASYTIDSKIGFYCRKAIAVCEPRSLEITVIPEKGASFIYKINATIKTKVSTIQTSWLHDDAVMEERKLYKDDPTHPINTIRSLTDILGRENED